MIFYGSSESHFIIKKMPDTAGSEKAALPNVVRKDGALTIRSI